MASWEAMQFPRAGRGAPFIVLISLLVVALLGCSGGSDASAKSRRRTAAPEGSTLDLESGGVQVETTGAPATLADGDRDAIVNTVRKYVIAATIDPFRGKPVGDLSRLFTLPAVAALSGLDRVAALDEGIPKATGTVKVTSAPMIITALSDPLGGINLVGTSLYIDARAEAKDGPVRVKRTGQLVLSRDGDTWKIASFKLAADRSGSGLGTTTTSRATGDSTP
jgi:hypothetical protein